MTRLRAAAAARLALRATASSSSPGFGSVAPRSNSYAPVSCFVPFSRLTGSLRDCTIRFSLEELQFEWERDPSSADHWIDAVAGVGSSADHCVDPVADAPSFGQILEEDIQLPLLIKAYEVRARIMNKASSFGLEDRPFPDRCYRRNRADLEKEFSYGVSVMPGAHFEKFRALSPHRPLNCHLDDRVCCDWFWKPDAAAVLSMPPKIGDVSDEELLDLLNLAFASDAATIVRRARELLSSKVDPLQLLAQLANLIMDILAAKHPSDSSEVRRVTGRHTSADVDVHKLKNALEILSETEKQLKTTKNQSTWLTAALLQFNMREPYCLDDTAVSSMFTESQTDDGTPILKDESFDTSSHLCSQNKVGSLDMNLGDPDVLETIWIKALENCSSRPLQNLLRKDGKLSSLYTSQGVAVAELQFCHPEDVPTSETFWKPLCASLQNLLKCNVDIRINLSPIFSNRMGSKDSSVSLVMQSREDRETQDPVATNCRTVASSQRDCPSLLSGQAKEKPSHILGCLHGTADGDTVDTESRILSYQKISVVPAASTPGNAPMKAGGDTSKMTPSTGRGSSIKFRWQAASNSSSVGLGLVSSSTRLHGGRNIVMTPCRGYCTNLELPTEKIPPPREWLVPVFEESQMWRAFPPDSFRSESALLMKTVPGVIPHMCTDELTFLLNYDPYAYVKARPLFRREVIHGAKIDTSGDKPFIWLPYDHALYLLQSLPLLARFFHEQGLCLPRLTLNDLAITGAGTFRLRGAPTSIKFRERTPGNIRDVYSNIRSLLMELVVASVGPDILVELPSELHSLFQLMDDGFKNEYLICFNSFFIPLSNKSSALLRIIDAILELPLKNNKILKLLLKSVYTVKWQDTVKSNAYLTRWFRFRRYGEGRREFILYLRVTICHKLEHGLPDKFVDFLVYATFQNVLMGLQKTLSDIGRLRDFHMEELYLHNARPGFVPFIDESLIAAGGSRDGTSIEVLYHSYLRRMQQGKRGVMVFHHGRRKLQNSVLAKLKLHGEGTVQGQE